MQRNPDVTVRALLDRAMEHYVRLVRPRGVVEELSALLDGCRQDLGDEATGVQGRNVREAGRVEDPDTLTHYDPDHPYIIAMYDLKERG